jgi:hypothetical protein
MERHHTVRKVTVREASAVDRAGSASGNRRQASPSPQRLPNRVFVRRIILALIEQMVRHRPLFFWSTVWMVPLLLSLMAVAALLTPEYAAQLPQRSQPLSSQPLSIEQSSTAIATQPVAAARPVSTTSVSIRAMVNQQDDSLSLWSLGAIVLTCAAGSVFILRRLSRSPQSAPRLIANGAVKLRNATPLTAHSRVIGKTTLPAVHPHLPQPAPALTVRSKSAEVQPTVTVVSPEASLVEMMDIRKRRSLSSWL